MQRRTEIVHPFQRRTWHWTVRFRGDGPQHYARIAGVTLCGVSYEWPASRPNWMESWHHPLTGETKHGDAPVVSWRRIEGVPLCLSCQDNARQFPRRARANPAPEIPGPDDGLSFADLL